jgi:hypothetical protein
VLRGRPEATRLAVPAGRASTPHDGAAQAAGAGSGGV